MTKYFEKIVDTVNNTETIVEITGSALEALLRDQEIDRKEREKRQAERAEIKEKKQKILDKLGLTEEEARLLLS
jgi:hypothetical protein